MTEITEVITIYQMYPLLSFSWNLCFDPRPPKRKKTPNSLPHVAKHHNWGLKSWLSWSYFHLPFLPDNLSIGHISVIMAPGPWSCQSRLSSYSRYHIYHLTCIFTHMNLFLRPTLQWWSGSHLLFAFRYLLSSPSSVFPLPEYYHVNIQIFPIKKNKMKNKDLPQSHIFF